MSSTNREIADKQGDKLDRRQLRLLEQRGMGKHYAFVQERKLLDGAQEEIPRDEYNACADIQSRGAERHEDAEP